MANISVSGTAMPTPLTTIMNAETIQPGAAASYELCKLIYEFHPLAGKIIEKPIALALSKPRKINVPCAIEEKLRDAFEAEWKALGCIERIRDVMHLSRVYGVASVIYGSPDKPTDKPIDPWQLADLPNLYFNVYDPLNLAGSVVTNQNPNAPDFQKSSLDITAAGQPYHRSRSYTVFCGTPVYLSYQSSSFSFSGRSLFLRALFPLKSFIQTMTVDDLVSLKAGLIIAKVQQPGSIVNRLMEKAAQVKRALLQEAQTGNVLSIQPEESIESIDLNNTDKAMTVARDNIIANVAAASDVPAILLRDEAFTQGFGEGTEDSKAVAQYIEGLRNEMAGLFEFFDKLVQHRAWSPAFYETLKAEHPDLFGKSSYEAFFYGAQKLFKAEWPTLIEEPKSEIVRRDSDKLKAMTDVVKTLTAVLDPDNKARVVQWFADNLNDLPELFTGTFEFDMDAMAAYEPPAPALPPGFGGAPGKADEPKADARADAEHWITLHPGGGGEGKGVPVLINGQGQIVGGAGGKLDGKTLDHVKSKSRDVEKPTVKRPPGSEHDTGEHETGVTPWQRQLIDGFPKAVERLRQQATAAGRTDIDQLIASEREFLIADLVENGMDKHEARQELDKVMRAEPEPAKGVDREYLQASTVLLRKNAQRMAEKPGLYTDADFENQRDLYVDQLVEHGMPEAEAKEYVEAIQKEIRAEAAKKQVPQPATAKPKFVPYVRQKTAKAVAETLVGAGYVAKADFGKVSADVANDAAESLTSHLQRFPELAARQKFIGSAQSRMRLGHEAQVERHLKHNAEWLSRVYPGLSHDELKAKIGKHIKKHPVGGYLAASCDGNEKNESWGPLDGVFVNEKYGSAEKARAAMEHCVKTKFHPEGCDSVKAIMDHEYGHQVDGLLNLRQHPEIQAIWRDALANRQTVTDELSEYAWRDNRGRVHSGPHEYIAEAWSEYNNNPNPRPRAVAIGKLIERIYGEKFGNKGDA